MSKTQIGEEFFLKDLGTLSRLRSIDLHTCMWVLEMQKLGDVCLRYPTSCFFCKILDAYIDLEKNRPKIADLTFGLGKFYIACRKYISELWAVDVKKWSWYTQPDKFILGRLQDKYVELPQKYFDVVVFDPPYPTHSAYEHKNSRVEEVEVLYFNNKDYLSIVNSAPQIAKHLLKPSGLVIFKVMDTHINGVIDWKFSHMYVVEQFLKAGFKLLNIFIWRLFVRQRPKTSNKWLKSHSYFLVFKL